MAWAASVARHVAKGIPPQFDRQDLVQEAQIAAWRAHEKWQPERKVPYRAFAYFAVRGAVLMCVRRRHWREGMHLSLDEHDADRPHAEHASADAHTDGNIERSQLLCTLLDEVIPMLPERMQRLIHMHFFLGIRMDDVAAALGMSETAAYAARREALMALRTKLRDMGVVIEKEVPI